jgi:hypothetical protein
VAVILKVTEPEINVVHFGGELNPTPRNEQVAFDSCIWFQTGDGSKDVRSALCCS